MKFEVAIVDDIVLNSDSKFFADVGQWDGIGAIRFKKKVLNVGLLEQLFHTSQT